MVSSVRLSCILPPWFQTAIARDFALTYEHISIANFDDSHAVDRGTIIVVNPEVC